MNVESYDKHGISFPDHSVILISSLTQIHTDGYTVIPSEDRKSDSQCYSHCIDILSVESEIRLVIIESGTIGTSSEIISDVVSIRYDFKSCSERL